MKPKLLNPKPSAMAIKKAAAWVKKKVATDKAKEDEMTLRMATVGHLFGSEEVTEDFKGSQSVKVGEHKLSAKFGFNTTVDMDALPAVYQSIGEELYMKLFRFSASVVDAEYKELTDEQRMIVDTALTSKRATIGLSLK